MMSINNRNDFITAASSEKLILAHVDAKKRLFSFTDVGDNVYSKVVENFITAIQQDDVSLQKVNNILDLVEGSFFYEIKTSTLYVKLFSLVTPMTCELIATFRLFFSNKTISCTHDFNNISEECLYHGRIVTGPTYKHKIGIDQALVSLVGEGTLQLKNQDGGLDSVFDRYIFENQDVTIFSWSPTLPPDQARVIYRGKTTNKTFDGIDVKLKIKDEIFALLDSPNISPYNESDNVTESVLGQYKRRVYGRVDGLRCQGTDQIGSGYLITGTVRLFPNNKLMLGSGTLFFTELQQGDKVIVGNQTFTIDDITNNTTATLSSESDYLTGWLPIYVVPERGSTTKNRKFIAAGHTCAEVTTTIVDVPQFNRIVVENTNGLFSGDFIEFLDTSERIEIKNIAPGNVVVLQQNIIQKPSIGTSITRRPIQEVYINNQRVPSGDFSIFNVDECGIILDNDVEFNLARRYSSQQTVTFSFGTRTVTYTPGPVAVDEFLRPGDWIKPNNASYTQYYKVVAIRDTTILLSTGFAQSTITDTLDYKSPDYLTDTSIVSVNILGKTTNGLADGEWIKTAAQAQRDLLRDANISIVNEDSFNEGSTNSPQLISYFIPRNFESKSLPTIKECVDDLSKSVRSSLTLDNDLLIKYQSLNVYTGQDIPVVRDYDVIDWKISATNGKTFSKVLARYRFTDVDLSTLISGNKFISHESQFVNRYIQTNKTDELPIYLYEEFDAKIAAHRHLFYNQLGTTTLTITTDLRLENIEIGQVIIADFRRLYKRFGETSHRKKVMIVIGKTLTGDRTELILSDLGNTFNMSSFITPNSASEYNLSTSDEKLIYGFITDNQGITGGDEETANTNLIS